MEIINFKKRGFSLIEVLAATLIFAVFELTMCSKDVIEAALLKQATHRLLAMSYAKSTAEALIKLNELGMADIPEFSTGTHTAATDPELCVLPDWYMKSNLEAKMEYIVTEISLPDLWSPSRRIEIIVEWKEKFPAGKSVKESLFVVVFPRY